MLAADEPPADLVCFHCQQGAEKYLKGFLAWHAVPFPRTHDLAALLAAAVLIAPDLRPVAERE
jgi:HEPN domain-containing protein